jgi:hypothetical protein
MRKRRDLRPDCIEIAFAAAVVVAIAPQGRIFDLRFLILDCRACLRAI